MPNIQVTTLGGLNTYLNPLIKGDGELIRSVNVDSFPFGAKTKRSGYITYLGTPDTSQVQTLFNWTKNDGTTFFNYRASGTALYYSAQGTGAWTLCGNGTITANAHIGHAVLDDTLIICDGAGSTRHTTNGTSFTDTTLAPVAVDLAQFQNRIYAAGTSSTLFYSTTNDATNWDTTGTSDSSSLTIPGAGKLSSIFTVADRLMANKNSGLQYRWDGFSLVDTATKLAPSSPYSVAQREGFFFWLTRLGYMGYGGDRPQLLSNAIQRQIYNDEGSAIVGTVFDDAPGVTHKYDYFCSVGDTTDDFTGETVTNCIQKYDYQKNQWMNYSYAHKPTAWLSYKDESGNDQLIFGDANGQCYQVSGTATTDAGSPIETVVEFVHHGGAPQLKKHWRWFTGFFNPGCEAKVQTSIGDSFTKDRKNWRDVGDFSDGIGEDRFKDPDNNGKLLFVKIYDSSKEKRYTFYGYDIQADVEPRR
jgi:hypothetical protein